MAHAPRGDSGFFYAVSGNAAAGPAGPRDSWIQRHPLLVTLRAATQLPAPGKEAL